MFVENILGLLLHIANSKPNSVARHPFYALKVKLLQQYGRLIGYDLQHIVYHCWNCEAGCERCNTQGCGNGVWEQVWVRLERWQMGTYIFNVPIRRTFYDPEEKVTLEGFVKHKLYPYHLSAECAYLLFLLFEPRLFVRTLVRNEYQGIKVTPLVWIATILFYLRKYTHRDWLNKIKDRLISTFSSRREFVLLHLLQSDTDEIPF
jgi:hypothetical protein